MRMRASRIRTHDLRIRSPPFSALDNPSDSDIGIMTIRQPIVYMHWRPF